MVYLICPYVFMWGGLGLLPFARVGICHSHFLYPVTVP